MRPTVDLDIDSYDIDAYTVSAYKVFSRHNYGFAWLSPRLKSACLTTIWMVPRKISGNSVRAIHRHSPAFPRWLITSTGWDQNLLRVSQRRERVLAAGKAIKAQESHLVDVMINGKQWSEGVERNARSYCHRRT